MTTCRTYPRTLAQAFPRTTLYACAVERPAPRPYPRVMWIALLVGLLVALIEGAFRG